MCVRHLGSPRPRACAGVVDTGDRVHADGGQPARDAGRGQPARLAPSAVSKGHGATRERRGVHGDA
eukprot:594064-Pleurochrysis_carterae.AAC.2